MSVSVNTNIFSIFEFFFLPLSISKKNVCHASLKTFTAMLNIANICCKKLACDLSSTVNSTLYPYHWLTEDFYSNAEYC